MTSTRARALHRRLGIAIAFFLFVQAVVGMLMGIGRLASLDMSPTYNLLFSVHADWDPFGSIYRVVLGLATATQAILGILIFLRLRHKAGEKSIATIPPSPDRPYELRKEASTSVLTFAADIRPLFRDRDIKAMKPMGIDLSSYEDVKEHAQAIYTRLSAGGMPCDGPWNDGHIRKLEAWIQSGMAP